MRGCLFVVVVAAAVAALAAWFGGPALAGVLVEAALRASGFEARTTSVRVVVDPPVAVLTGRADRVEVTATNATFDQLRADDLELTLVDVDLTGRTFASVLGTVRGAVVDGESGRVRIERIDLSGPADAVNAAVAIDGREVERLAVDALREMSGLPIGDARLAPPDLLRFSVAARPLNGRFVVEPDGALSIAAPLPGNPRIEVVEGEPLRFETVAVLDGDLALTGTIDLTGLVR